MKKKYHVCCAETLVSLEQTVEYYLKEGYELQGGLVIQGTWYLQVVIK